MLISDALQRSAANYPDKVALQDEYGKHYPRGHRFTYRELHQSVNRLANGFLDIGLGTCWSCPDGSRRTVLHPVDGGKACQVPAYEDFKTARRGAKPSGILRTDCPSGQFLDRDTRAVVHDAEFHLVRPDS